VGVEEEEEEEEDPTTYFARGQEAVAALHEGELMEEATSSNTVQFARNEEAMAGLLAETPEPAVLAGDEEEDDEDLADEPETASLLPHFADEDAPTGHLVSEVEAVFEEQAPSEPPPPVQREPAVMESPRQAPPRRSKLWMVVMGLGSVAVVAALVAGVTLFLLTAGGFTYTTWYSTPSQPGTQEPVPDLASAKPSDGPSDAPADTPESEAPEEVGAAPSEPAPNEDFAGARFESLWEGTKKIAVRCDNVKADGVSEATVEGENLGSCTVTAIGASRNRQTAVVKQVEPRHYRCFKGGEKTCE